MANRRDRIEKLRRMAESNNPHEAAIAREALKKLLAKPDPAESNNPDLRFMGQVDGVPRYWQAMQPASNSGQLPGVFRVPTKIGARR